MDKCVPQMTIQARTAVKRVFITNVKGTFLGMSESEEASKRLVLKTSNASKKRECEALW